MVADCNEAPPIFKLNAYCLVEIFSLLGLKDQLSFATISDCFQDALLSHLNWCKRVVIDEKVKKKDLPKLLSFCNQNIKELKTIIANGTKFGYEENFLYFLRKYISTLVELRLTQFVPLHPKVLDKLLLTSNIKVLQLSRCQLSDAHCYALQKCTNIEKLDLSENYAISGEYLDKFPKLIELNLNFCRRLLAYHLTVLIRVSCELQYVHVAYCNNINEITLRAVSKHLRNIKTLTVSDTFRSKKLHLLLRLPKLERMEIHGLKNLKPHFFEELFHLKESIMHTLKFVANKRDKNDLNFDKICSMHSLKYLTIKNCNKLDDQCVENISDLENLTYLNLTGCKNVTPCALKKVVVKSKDLIKLDISFYEPITSFIEDLSSELQSTNRNRKIILCINGISQMDFEKQANKTPLNLENISLIVRPTSPMEFNPYELYRKPSL